MIKVGDRVRFNHNALSMSWYNSEGYEVVDISTTINGTIMTLNKDFTTPFGLERKVNDYFLEFDLKETRNKKIKEIFN